MKTRCIFAAIAAIVAVGAAVGYDKQTKKTVSSDLAIANIEALTTDEWGYDTGCVSDGDGCILRYNRWYPNDKPLNY